MGQNNQKLKKVGFWYKTGKGWKQYWSGISGEYASRVRSVETSSIDGIMEHLFMSDLHKVIEEFGFPDPEIKKDPETGEIVKETKSLGEFREYVAKRINLKDLENYLERDPVLVDITGLNRIRPSKIAFYVGLIASIQEEIDWTSENIIDDLLKENLSDYEFTPYVEYWTEQLERNFTRFKISVENLESRKQTLSRVKFDEQIFEEVTEIAQKCVAYYDDLISCMKKGDFNHAHLSEYLYKFNGAYSKLNVSIKTVIKSNETLNLDTSSKNVMNGLIDLRTTINDLFLSRFKLNILNQYDEPTVKQVSQACLDQKEFFTNVSALGTLIDRFNEKGIRDKIKGQSENGSINALNQFLSENLATFNPRIISNLRVIKRIRKQWPTHQNTPEGVQAIKEVCGAFPIEDYSKCWSKVLELYVESLNLLQVDLKMSRK